MTDDSRIIYCGCRPRGAEVEFLDFEQSIIGFCVMQYILDETLPLQAALLMAILRKNLVVDTVLHIHIYIAIN